MSRIMLGIKLWSSNLDCLPSVKRSIVGGDVHYIEIMPVPSQNDVEPFQQLKCPVVIHVNTDRRKINIADPAMLKENLKSIQNDIRWADELNAKNIIVHPGLGNIHDAVKFIRGLNDERVIVENMPKISLNGDIMIAHSIEDIKTFQNHDIGFCLDFNHAMRAATSLNIPEKRFIRDLNSISPMMFHISDGNKKREKDEHIHLGAGDFDIPFFVNIANKKQDSYVTLETPKNTVEDDARNIEFIKKVIARG